MVTGYTAPYVAPGAGTGAVGGPTPEQLAAERAHAVANAGQMMRFEQTAPTQTPHALGTSGIPFGGGQFAWTGSGWSDPTSGRQWDPVGNLVQAQPAQPSPAVAQQQAQASPLVDWWRTHAGKDVNAYAFNRLPTSTRELTLAAAEAAGHEKGDVFEQIQRTLPKAVGPRTGYIAPLGSR